MTEESWWYPFLRETGEGYMVMCCEFFEREGRVHGYLRLRCNEAHAAAGSDFVRVVLSRPPGGQQSDLPEPEDHPQWLVDGLEDAVVVAAFSVALAAAMEPGAPRGALRLRTNHVKIVVTAHANEWC